MDDRAVESVAEELRRLIAEQFAEQRLVGASVGIVRDQELVWTCNLGSADLANDRPAGSDTLYRVASITKTLTAAAIFQLRDAGRLTLDDALVDHVPEIAGVDASGGGRDGVRALTLRRLLCHHSGLMSEAPGNLWETLEFPAVGDVIASLARAQVVIEPDSAFKYCNLGFILLGEVISRVAGQPYEQYIDAAILRPLGMSSSVFDPEPPLAARVATGYQIQRHEDQPGTAPHPPLHSYIAAGGLYSCVDDLARWAALQLAADADDDAARVLSPHSRAEMQQPQFMEPGWNAGYCLPWLGQRFGADGYLGHGGALPGFLSSIHFNRSRKLALIVLTNADGHTASVSIPPPVLQAIAAADERLAEPAPPPKPAATPEPWRQLVGDYVSRVFTAQCTVECRNGELLLVAPPAPGQKLPPVRLEPTADADRFRAASGRPAGEVVHFQRDRDGKVTGWTLAGSRWWKLQVTDGAGSTGSSGGADNLGSV